MDSHIKFRVPTEEKQLFVKRAEAQGLGLSEWIRLTLLAACKMKDVAAKLPDHRVDPDFVKKGSADVARGRLMSVTVDPKKVAGPVTVHGVVSPETQSKIRIAARLGVDPDKIEAFQHKTGMTAFDKRRK